MRVLAFDIETVPDVALGRRLLGLDGLSDEDVGKAMTFKHLQEAGTEFLPLYQHRIVAISVVLRIGDQLKIWSLGRCESPEVELIKRFYDGLENYTPELVSWNGGGFDLPVLHYRALLHGVQSPTYWEIGDEERNFRYNNYLSRFHWRHIDIMDVLSGFQPRARAGLDAIAVMLGFPGKMGIKGDQVWAYFLEKKIEVIRNYCETDVLNTYLIFLRFQHMRGILDDTLLESELERIRDFLKQSTAAHLQDFLAAWRNPASVAGSQ